eukprot:m.49337 g.49337  ORF g.49337 m.49337 type:complete len:102 (-) comp7446_c1_seq1:1204-1509(-)
MITAAGQSEHNICMYKIKAIEFHTMLHNTHLFFKKRLIFQTFTPIFRTSGTIGMISSWTSSQTCTLMQQVAQSACGANGSAEKIVCIPQTRCTAILLITTA